MSTYVYKSIFKYYIYLYIYMYIYVYIYIYMHRHRKNQDRRERHCNNDATTTQVGRACQILKTAVKC